MTSPFAPVCSDFGKSSPDHSFAPVITPKRWCRMARPILMPELGVPRATLGLWFVAEGEPVEEGERLIEVRAGAATFDIAAPATGRVERRAFPTDVLAAGQVLGYIEEIGAESEG